MTNEYIYDYRGNILTVKDENRNVTDYQYYYDDNGNQTFKQRFGYSTGMTIFEDVLENKSCLAPNTQDSESLIIELISMFS